jgi:hypothetical protein
MLTGGDRSMNMAYCNAILRAAILEGEVYILTIERGGKREIASWVVWFPPSDVPGNYPVCQVVPGPVR